MLAIALRLALAAAVVVASLKPVEPFSPQGNWKAYSPPGLSARGFYDAGLTPPDLFWTRGSETLRWALFDVSHPLDNPPSIVRTLSAGRYPSNEHHGRIKVTEEKRCSGKAWWATWIVYRDSADLEQRDLFFENHGREALIAYAFPRHHGSTDVLTSIVQYCAKFNP